MLLVALAVMTAGVVGAVIPGVPGVLIVFAAAVIYSIGTGFEAFHPLWLVPMLLIAVAATVIDFLASPAVARRFGASKWGVIGATVGVVAGLILGGPLGALIGPLIGAVAFELIFGQTVRQAFRSGLGTALGFLAGLAVEVAGSLAIMLLFLVLVVVVG